MSAGEERRIPVLHGPSDAFRDGSHRSFRDEVIPAHPVDVIQKRREVDAWKTELWTTERIYGPGAAMRLRMDRALLAQAQRAPGLASSFVGLDTFLGRDYTIGFEDFLGTPELSPLAPRVSVHEAFERKLGR